MNMIYTELGQELEGLKTQGLFKSERIITSPQSAEITVKGGNKVLNFCANNYLGLSSHPDVITAAKIRFARYPATNACFLSARSMQSESWGLRQKYA